MESKSKKNKNSSTAKAASTKEGDGMQAAILQKLAQLEKGGGAKQEEDYDQL